MREGILLHRNFVIYNVKGSYPAARGFIQNRDKYKDKEFVRKDLNKIAAYSRHITLGTRISDAESW